MSLMETDFAEVIGRLLKDKGRTRQELADHLELTASGISRKLGGSRPWRLDEVRAIAQFFGIPTRRLFTEDSQQAS